MTILILPSLIYLKRESPFPPPKLYDLTSLQRDANRIYGYTAQQTLDYLQSLYEKKLATYPRTDSQYITDDMEATATSLIENIYTVFDKNSSNADKCNSVY